MKVIFTILAIVLSQISALAQQSVINAKIKGIGNDTIFIELNPLSSNSCLKDTVLAHEGQFTYQKTVEQPTLVFIHSRMAMTYNTPAKKLYLPQSKRISLVMLPNDTSVIDGELNKVSLTYRVKGASINHELADYIMQELPEKIQQYVMELHLDSLFQSGNLQEANAFLQQYSAFKSIHKKDKLLYIQQHPDKDLSLLLMVSSNDPETFGTYADRLTERVKNGIFKTMFQERVELNTAYIKSKSIKVNEKSEEFSLPDLTGKIFSLSSCRGKYVVLDFWGTWCSPCIEGLPKMKIYYEKYKEKIEFVGIGCNDNEKSLKEVVKKNGLQWIQLLNSKIISNNVTLKYGIHLFPTKVLIDPTGNIINVFTGEGQDFYNKLDELFKM